MVYVLMFWNFRVCMFTEVKKINKCKSNAIMMNVMVVFSASPFDIRLNADKFYIR